MWDQGESDERRSRLIFRDTPVGLRLRLRLRLRVLGCVYASAQ